ncbi:ABC transporter permease subunit [Isachenkonia alkalipeptolytica]|uniref:ABC transporter permease subunit n=1 Tax=Isachenkonia alkalipeptolytica TaxID=2565777 RepID=A0AA43XKE5_9CLOT|nr:ABC transporter permease subunit [Isachenkonia alkalipeptolytica]
MDRTLKILTPKGGTYLEQIVEGFKSALSLIASFDVELYSIVGLTLFVTIIATGISALLSVPLGIFLGIKDFPLKSLAIRILYTCMSLPPVIVGLFVFLMIARRGPLGRFGILYTVTAMIIAQILLVTPIITGIVYNGTLEKGRDIKNLGKTLGASRPQLLFLLIRELRIELFAGVISGYGRAISEVGAVMIVGGNIQGHTRVMTTAIAMLRSMGDYEMAIALGLILLGLSFVVNFTLYHFQQKA